MLWIQRQRIGQRGGTGQFQAAQGGFADAGGALVAGKGLVELAVFEVGHVGLADEGLGRAGGVAFAAATQGTGPFLPRDSQDVVPLQGAGTDELHAVGRRGDPGRAGLQSIHVPAGQGGVLAALVTRGGDQGHQGLAIRAHGHRLDRGQTCQLLCRDRAGHGRAGSESGAQGEGDGQCQGLGGLAGHGGISGDGHF